MSSKDDTIGADNSRHTSADKVQPMRAPDHSRSGMTLLEVILAIAVAGFVLAAATSFVVSVSRIWMERETRHFFEDHVDGVTEFLRAAFANAAVEIAPKSTQSPSKTTDQTPTPSITPSANEDPLFSINLDKNINLTSGSKQGASGGGALISVAEEPISWAKPPGFADYREPLLNFKLAETPPLLVNIDNAPTIGIDAFLYFDQDEGLSLLWYSILQEESEDINDLRRTQISPLVKAIHYIYWDERMEKWDQTDKVEEGEGDDEYILPRFIKLTFEHAGETLERTLTIPIPSKHALIF